MLKVENFNSIKVRLELAEWQHMEKRPTFQFHKGTIRTRNHLSAALREMNFNSIKVRLELWLLYV